MTKSTEKVAGSNAPYSTPSVSHAQFSITGAANVATQQNTGENAAERAQHSTLNPAIFAAMGFVLPPELLKEPKPTENSSLKRIKIARLKARSESLALSNPLMSVLLNEKSQLLSEAEQKEARLKKLEQDIEASQALIIQTKEAKKSLKENKCQKAKLEKELKRSVKALSKLDANITRQEKAVKVREEQEKKRVQSAQCSSFQWLLNKCNSSPCFQKTPPKANSKKVLDPIFELLGENKSIFYSLQIMDISSLPLSTQSKALLEQIKVDIRQITVKLFHLKENAESYKRKIHKEQEKTQIQLALIESLRAELASIAIDSCEKQKKLEEQLIAANYLVKKSAQITATKQSEEQLEEEQMIFFNQQLMMNIDELLLTQSEKKQITTQQKSLTSSKNKLNNLHTTLKEYERNQGLFSAAEPVQSDLPEKIKTTRIQILVALENRDQKLSEIKTILKQNAERKAFLPELMTLSIANMNLPQSQKSRLEEIQITAAECKSGILTKLDELAKLTADLHTPHIQPDLFTHLSNQVNQLKQEINCLQDQLITSVDEAALIYISAEEEECDLIMHTTENKADSTKAPSKPRQERITDFVVESSNQEAEHSPSISPVHPEHDLDPDLEPSSSQAAMSKLITPSEQQIHQIEKQVNLTTEEKIQFEQELLQNNLRRMQALLEHSESSLEKKCHSLEKLTQLETTQPKTKRAEKRRAYYLEKTKQTLNAEIAFTKETIDDLQSKITALEMRMQELSSSRLQDIQRKESAKKSRTEELTIIRKQIEGVETSLNIIQSISIESAPDAADTGQSELENRLDRAHLKISRCDKLLKIMEEQHKRAREIHSENLISGRKEEPINSVLTLEIVKYFEQGALVQKITHEKEQALIALQNLEDVQKKSNPVENKIKQKRIALFHLNQAILELKAEQNQTQQEIENYAILQPKTSLKKLKATQRTKEKELKKMEKEIKKLESKITSLQRTKNDIENSGLRMTLWQRFCNLFK